ncbi:MAG: hypothetical protein V4496_06085 [Pseudomonadota bacterium]
MPELGLLGQLTTQKYVMASFLKEWLPVQSIVNLWTSAGTSSILIRSSLFMSPQHSLTQLTLEKATVSDLKKFLRVLVNTKFSSPIYSAEEIKKKILSSLNQPDADLEYRLLALNFLNENPFTFERPRNYDRLTLLLYCANPSIDPGFIAKEIQRLLYKARENFQRIRQRSKLNNELHDPTKAIIIDIVLMLNSTAHKLERNQAGALIAQAYNFCKKARSYFNWRNMQETIYLLAMLTVKYQVKELHELVEFLADLDESSQGSIYPNSSLCRTISEVASQHPSTFTTAISQGLLNNISNNVAHAYAVLEAEKNNFLGDSQSDLVKNAFWTLLNPPDIRLQQKMIEHVIHLWSHLGDSTRGTISDKLLALLSDSDDKYSRPVRGEAIRAVTHLWNHFGDNLREAMSNKLFALLSDTRSDVCGEAIEAVACLWHHLKDNQRDIIKNTLLTLLSHADINIRSSAIAAATGLWDHFEDSQRDIVKNTLLELLSSHVNFDFRDAAASLWDQFNDSQRDNILSRLLRTNKKALLNDDKTFIISIISALSERQVSTILERIVEFLDDADVDVRTKAFDIFTCIICHHPDHDYHAHLNALKDPLLKAYLVHAADTIRAALQLPAPINSHP